MAKKQEKLASSTWADWCPNSEWQPAPGQHSSGARHSWETCPPAPSREWDQPQVSVAQREEQMQLLWALTDKTDPPQPRTHVTAPQPCAHTQRKQPNAASSSPRPRSHPKGRAVVSPTPYRVNDRRKQQVVRRRMIAKNLILRRDRERTLRSARFSSLLSLPILVLLVPHVCLIIRANKKWQASNDSTFPLGACR